MTRPPWCDDSNLPRVWCEHCGGKQLGIFDGIDDATYHADEGSLSSSGARTIINRSPAHFRWERDHGRKPKKAFDLGHAVHGELLGVGQPVFVLDPEVHGLKADGTVSDAPANTKAWKTAVADARARGEVPVAIDDWAAVERMVAEAHAHSTAHALLSSGVAEQSIYWRDEVTGELLRARPDWMRVGRGGRLVVLDAKTTSDASPDEFARSAGKFGYHCQQAWYLDGIVANWEAVCAAVGADPTLDPHDPDKGPLFVFLVVEVDEPHPVLVAQLDPADVELGRQLNRRAIDIYAECRRTDQWPAYGTEVHQIALPYWNRKQLEESLS